MAGLTGVAALRRLGGLVGREWALEASRWTSPGVERAALRLMGIEGLDPAGRPLAEAVLQRMIGDDPTRLARGAAAVLVAAADAYDVDVETLAQDVASGAIDLTPEERAAGRWASRDRARRYRGRMAAVRGRLEAQRTARRELMALLGDPPQPWLWVRLPPSSLDEARRRAEEAVAAGATVLEVPAPPGWELRQLARTAGGGGDATAPTGRSIGGAFGGSPRSEPVPAGSRRGLAALRRHLDELAAGAGRYLRLAVRAPALATAETAATVGLERLDLLVVNPLGEVSEGIDPRRVLTDLRAAARLVALGGGGLVIAAGPIWTSPAGPGGRAEDGLAPDREGSSDPTEDVGRRLALHLALVGLATAAGLRAEGILVEVPPADPLELGGSDPLNGGTILWRVCLGQGRLLAVLPDHPTAPALAALALLAAPDLAGLVSPDREVGRIAVSLSAARRVRGLVESLRPSSMVRQRVEAAAGTTRTSLEILRRGGWTTMGRLLADPSIRVSGVVPLEDRADPLPLET